MVLITLLCCFSLNKINTVCGTAAESIIEPLPAMKYQIKLPTQPNGCLVLAPVAGSQSLIFIQCLRAHFKMFQPRQSVKMKMKSFPPPQAHSTANNISVFFNRNPNGWERQPAQDRFHAKKKIRNIDESTGSTLARSFHAPFDVVEIKICDLKLIEMMLLAASMPSSGNFCKYSSSLRPSTQKFSL